MADLPWFRLYTDMVDNEKIRLLAFEDRWHFVAILCCKQQGVLKTKDNLLERKIAVKLGLQLRELDEVKRRLMEVGLINDEWDPHGWEEHQFKSDSSTERTRKYREQKRNKTENVTGTSPERHGDLPDTDKDTEADSDTEQTQKETIVSIFEFWKETLHHEKAKLDDKRERAIRKALKLKYSIDDLKAAIVGCSRTPFNMGQNDNKQVYDDITLIFRDSGHIETFIKNAEVVQHPQEPANRYRVYGAGNETTRH